MQNRKAFSDPLTLILIYGSLCAFALLMRDWDPRGQNLETATFSLCILVLLALPQLISALLDETRANLSIALIWAGFLIAYPLSGLAHFAYQNELPRGFVDYIRDPSRLSGEGVYLSLALVSVAQCGLHLGLCSANSSQKAQVSHIPPVLIPQAKFLGILFVLLSAYSITQLFRASDSMIDTLTTVNRAFEAESGYARFYFMSQWGVWGALFLLAYGLSRSRRVVMVILYICLYASFVVASVFWSGARSSAVYYLLPAFLLIIRSRPRFVTPVATVLGGVILVYIIVTTALRTITYDQPAMTFGEGVINVVDWQLGRFSMTGYADELVQKYGWGWGSTILNSIAKTINIPFTLLKFEAIVPEPMAITNLTGLDLRDDMTKTGIVPGSACELYYNFGILGIFIGYYLAGVITRRLNSRLWRTRTLSSLLLVAYFMILIPVAFFGGMVSDIIYSYVVYGFPLFVLRGMEAVSLSARDLRLADQSCALR